ncbi:MAG: hypothetical protein ACLFR7_06610, partial [Opitutales bacterium]
AKDQREENRGDGQSTERASEMDTRSYAANDTRRSDGMDRMSGEDNGPMAVIKLETGLFSSDKYVKVPLSALERDDEDRFTIDMAKSELEEIASRSVERSQGVEVAY